MSSCGQAMRTITARTPTGKLASAQGAWQAASHGTAQSTTCPGPAATFVRLARNRRMNALNTAVYFLAVGLSSNKSKPKYTPWRSNQATLARPSGIS